MKKGVEIVTNFAWITSIEITNRNAKKLVTAGRNRWKIENQGFNRQKRWQGDTEHACSFHEKAQKNHYGWSSFRILSSSFMNSFFYRKMKLKKHKKYIF